MLNCISLDIQTNKQTKKNRIVSKQYHFVDGCWGLLIIRTGFESFIAGVIDGDEEDNGLMMLICLGTSGTVSPLFTEETECDELWLESVLGDVTNRIVGGDVEVDCCGFDSADLAIERRITRALLCTAEVISFDV